MNRMFGAMLLALVATGCRPWDFDDVDAVDLGVPGGGAFAYSDIGEVMFVFSDISYVCELLQSPEPPLFSDWWVVSAWTRSATRIGEELPAEGFATVSVYDHGPEHVATDAWIELRTLDDEYARGTVFMELDNGDRIKARFEADRCDADLFIGLE